MVTPGRRGYLNHLTVLPDYRRQGTATRLVQSCLSQLQQQSIDKCHLFILNDNEAAYKFWLKRLLAPTLGHCNDVAYLIKVFKCLIQLFYCAAYPPSTGKASPVTKDDLLDSNQSTA